MSERNDIPSTRREAIQSGSTHYHTGNPCPKGHIDLRYASSGGCIVCALSGVKSRVDSGYFRSLYEANKEQILSQQKQAYRDNRDMRVKTRQRAAKWAASNPERSRTIKQNYKARRRATKASGLSYSDLHTWKQQQDKVCYWCGNRCDKEFTVDHYEPLSKGGAHETENLVIACVSCNVKKNARDPYEFAQSVGRLF